MDAIKENLEDLKIRLQHDKNIDIDKRKEEILFILGSEIVSRYYYQTGVTEYSLAVDKELKEAVELLGKPEDIKTILQ